jgi:hypothetical protein
MGMFLNSCLGKLVVALFVILLLSIVAWITCPTEAHMREEMNDDLVQCILKNDSVRMDPVDEFVANIGYFFSKAKTSLDRPTELAFRKHNRTEIYNHGTFATMYLYNNMNADGVRCAFGIFGMVFPMLSYSEILLSVEPIRNDFKPKEVEIPVTRDTTEFGEIPNLIFQDEEYD